MIIKIRHTSTFHHNLMVGRVEQTVGQTVSVAGEQILEADLTLELLECLKKSLNYVLKVKWLLIVLTKDNYLKVASAILRRKS